jgi:hypothetical protein
MQPLSSLSSSSAASGYVCPVDDAAESFVVGVVGAPDDVPADRAGLLLVGGVVCCARQPGSCVLTVCSCM